MLKKKGLPSETTSSLFLNSKINYYRGLSLSMQLTYTLVSVIVDWICMNTSETKLYQLQKCEHIFLQKILLCIQSRVHQSCILMLFLQMSLQNRL